MNEKTYRYALATSKNKRATIASEIVQGERHQRYLKEQLGHVDATIRLLDPSTNPEAIPTKRPVKRVKLFRQGELGRMIPGALRNAVGELPTAAIVDAVLAAGGHGEAARPAMAPRVRGNLAYLERRGIVLKGGKGSGARWMTKA